MDQGAGTDGAGSALPPSQLPLDLGETPGRGLGVAVPARWAPELAELAALVERPVAGQAQLVATVGHAGRPRDDDGAPAGVRSGEFDPATVVPGAEQVAAFEDLHARLRQVLGALDAG